MKELFPEIVQVSETQIPLGDVIGHSREGRPIEAYSLGVGPTALSLIGGCHADEPVGPCFLRKLAGYLSSLSSSSELLKKYQWWIVPHLNPDGEERNRKWYESNSKVVDIVSYLRYVQREKPGDDIEFGFPRNELDCGARLENTSVYQWWQQAETPFFLHVSLHSMAFAGGPWFLIEPAWSERVGELIQTCRNEVQNMGYRLHDVQRHGEKGFFRLEQGFATRPDSSLMKKYFLERKDIETAEKFRPSSMESMRTLGADVLTLVSEMPFFVLPGVGEKIGPPDTLAEQWREKIEQWRKRLQDGEESEQVLHEAKQAGVQAMPLRDQMYFQWLMIVSGIDLIS